MATPSRTQPGDAVSSPQPSGVETPRQNASVGRGYSKQLRHIVRGRLLDEINIDIMVSANMINGLELEDFYDVAQTITKYVLERAIGREIYQRNPNVLVDPRKDDEEPPNLYKWKFSPKYLEFPVEGVSRWSVKDHESCIEAVNQGWLSVVALPASPNKSVPHKNGQKGPIVSNTAALRESIPAASSKSIPSEKLRPPVTGHAFEDDHIPQKSGKTREATGSVGISELVRSIFERVEVIEDFLKPKMAAIKDSCALLDSEFERLQTLYGGLEEKCASLTSKNQNLEHEVDYVNDNFEVHKMVIEDLRKKRVAQEEENLAQLKRVREEWSQKESEMQAKHLIEVSRLREERRHEDEELVQLLNDPNANYSARKRREIRNIYHNWKDVPQNILPKSMIPEGSIPSDRVLLLLARLSRVERDPEAATALLTKEIARRNNHLPDVRRDIILTSGDIERVLSAFCDEPGIRPTSAVSSTPQPALSVAAQRTPAFNISGRNTWEIERFTRGAETASSDITSSNQTEATRVSSRSLSFQRRSTSEASEYIDIDDNRAAVIEIAPRRPNSTRRALRRSLLNPEDIELAPPSEASDSSMIPENPLWKVIKARTIHEEIAGLPLPPKELVPEFLHEFPMGFVKEYIRGDATAFSKCGRTTIDKQIVTWPEMIKMNEETHPLCPLVGSNGALTFVEGRPNTGDIAKVYPTLLREKVGFFKYIGHYKVVKRITMPVETWRQCDLEARNGIVAELDSKWGEVLLRSKGLCVNGADGEDKRIQDVLGFFERPSEPCLRMSWTLLQFVSFEWEDYNILLNALQDWQNGEDTEAENALEVPANDWESRSIIPERTIFSKPQEKTASVKSTIPSSTNETDDNNALEHIVQAEDGSWRVHGFETSCDPATITPDHKATLLKSQSTSVSTKRQYVEEEEEEELYDATPPLQTRAPVAPMTPVPDAPLINVARPPNRTLQEILASYTSSKRRKLGDGKQKNVD